MILDDWISERAAESDTQSTDAGSSSPWEEAQQGVWYDGGPPDLVDNYLQAPTPKDQGMLGGLEQAINGWLSLPDTYPTPVVRLLCRNLSAMVVLHESNPSQQVRSDGRLELEINGLTVSMDTFPEGGHQIRRSALYVQSLELRDCSPHALDPSTGGVWRYILSRHRCKWPGLPSPGPQGTVGTPMVEFVLEAVRPDVERQGSESMEEYRLRLAIAPLRLRLDQAVVGFLQSYCKSLAAMDVDTPPSGAGEDAMFFQHIEVAPLFVVVDYRPRTFDLAALRGGSMVEVLNMVRWGGVKVNLKGIRLAGMKGWDTLVEALSKEWTSDVAGTQAHKFVTGIPPFRSFRRIGTAASDLVTVSVKSIRRPPDDPARHHCSPPSRRIARSAVSLLRVITLEVLNAAVTVAGGAQLVLQGKADPLPGPGAQTKAGPGAQPQAGQHPQAAGVKGGLKQAAACLESAVSNVVLEPIRSFRGGEGMGTAVAKALRAAPSAAVAPATAAATAVRCTLLGVRNALDVDHSLDE
ncbi:unnamed protein product [Ostreobium quekettii]|uniref:Autophagy-related protein 2 n=1 Tax=Ostreobium quekettii TaxID=121088 RepID=A0A8S1J594_9CHLO|nr:unnamed protein product [Ostreobium quekettii]